jgi:multiple sugar transport system permease protein
MASTPTTSTPKAKQIRQRLQRVVVYVTVFGVSLITIFPVYWMAVSTFQPNKYTLHFPPPLFPQEIVITQFAELFGHHPVALWLRNSFLIAAMTMLLCTALSVLGAYALSSLRWKGRSTFGLFLLVTQMLPEILVLIPIYIIYRRLGLLNDLPALSLINGAFILPLTAPGIVAVAVVSFFFSWNEYLYASILLGKAEIMPASVGLTTLKSIASTPIEQYMAAGLIFSILPVLFYLTMQRYIVSGLTAGAVKG